MSRFAIVLVTKACGVLCAVGMLLSAFADELCGSAGGDAVLATRQVLLRRLLVPQLRHQHACRAQLRAVRFLPQHQRDHQARCRVALRRSQHRQLACVLWVQHCVVEGRSAQPPVPLIASLVRTASPALRACKLVFS